MTQPQPHQPDRDVLLKAKLDLECYAAGLDGGCAINREEIIDFMREQARAIDTILYPKGES